MWVLGLIPVLVIGVFLWYIRTFDELGLSSEKLLLVLLLLMSWAEGYLVLTLLPEVAGEIAKGVLVLADPVLALKTLYLISTAVRSVPGYKLVFE